MKLQRFVSVWYTHMHTQFLYTRLPGIVLHPQQWAQQVRSVQQPFALVLQDLSSSWPWTVTSPWRSTAVSKNLLYRWVKWDSDNYNTPPCIFPAKLSSLPYLYSLGPSPSWSPQHQQWQEVFVIPEILHVSLLAALRLCKHSDRSYLRDYLSIAQLHSWAPLLLLRAGLAVIGTAGQLGP